MIIAEKGLRPITDPMFMPVAKNYQVLTELWRVAIWAHWSAKQVKSTLDLIHDGDMIMSTALAGPPLFSVPVSYLPTLK